MKKKQKIEKAMATLKVAFLTLRVRFHNFPAFQYFLLVRHVLQTVSTVFFPSPVKPLSPTPPPKPMQSPLPKGEKLLI